MAVRTDFHSHILPGIDDGSSSVEESLAMLRMEAEQGIERVVATPHFYARYASPEEFLMKRDHSEEILRRAMAEHQGLPDLQIGAEVYYFRGISESEFLPELAIRGTNYILIEMPPAPWQDIQYRELVRIRERRDLIPIIAHIDRYIKPFRTYGIPRRLYQLPVLVQANANFFVNPVTAGMAVKMLKNGYIQLLGSDCHNLTSRKPNLEAARNRIRRKLGESSLQMLSRYESVVFDTL